MTDAADRDIGTPDMTGTRDPTRTDPDVSLTTAAAAEMVGVSPRTIRRWIEKGTLPAMTGAGGVFYVFAGDVEEAKRASLSRRSGASQVTARFPVVGDNNTVPDESGATGASYVTPDPAGGAAGAILVAWRDTVLAPVVEELSATRRELGEVRQALGRTEAERDALRVERDTLRLAATVEEATQDAPREPTAHERREAFWHTPAEVSEGLIDRLRRLIRR